MNPISKTRRIHSALWVSGVTLPDGTRAHENKDVQAGLEAFLQHRKITPTLGRYSRTALKLNYDGDARNFQIGAAIAAAIGSDITLLDNLPEHPSDSLDFFNGKRQEWTSYLQFLITTANIMIDLSDGDALNAGERFAEAIEENTRKPSATYHRERLGVLQ